VGVFCPLCAGPFVTYDMGLQSEGLMSAANIVITVYAVKHRKSLFTGRF